jgi:hypothetical protein
VAAVVEQGNDKAFEDVSGDRSGDGWCAMTNYWGYNRYMPEDDQPEHASDGSRHIDASNYTGYVEQCLCGEQFADMAELEQHIMDEAKAAKREVERKLFRLSGLRNFLTERRRNSNVNNVRDAATGEL